MSKWQDYRPKKGLSLQEVEGELVILDQARYKIHQLNPSASVVWRTIEELSSVDADAALAAVLDHFEVDEQAAAADVKQTIEQFIELKLLIDKPEDD